MENFIFFSFVHWNYKHIKLGIYHLFGTSLLLYDPLQT